MSNYRVVCTTQEPVNESARRAHIVAVGTGADASQAEKRWTLAEVLQAMDSGDVFYTKGETSGKIARVEKFKCPSCSRTHIRSEADHVSDNNLDELRFCNWRS